MTNSDDQVYPTFDSYGNQRGGACLTKRELFAAMAMQGLCASGMFTDRRLQGEVNDANKNCTMSDALAIAATGLAGALIIELNITNEPH